MIRRFADGDEGRRRLEEALREQRVVGHDPAIAKAIADCAEVTSYAVGEVIIKQDAADTDVFLILVGTVTVEIGGRPVAQRKAGEHVGEMGMIDTSARRSATTRATTETVVARVKESSFAPIANDHPEMWRRLAIDLGKRLRERGDHVRPVNEKPVVFVGSTTERLPIARALQSACQHDPWVTRVWTDGVFGAGKNADRIARRPARDARLRARCRYRRRHRRCSRREEPGAARQRHLRARPADGSARPRSHIHGSAS